MSPIGQVRRDWTDEERAYLRANYGILTPAEIARHLNRTSPGIRGMACRMELTEKKPKSKSRARAKHQRRRCKNCNKLYLGSKCKKCT